MLNELAHYMQVPLQDVLSNQSIAEVMSSWNFQKLGKSEYEKGGGLNFNGKLQMYVILKCEGKPVPGFQKSGIDFGEEGKGCSRNTSRRFLTRDGRPFTSPPH